MAAPKIIVLGSLNGHLEAALKKVAALHSKNNFSLAILTGQVFPPASDDDDDDADSAVTALLDGSIEVPLPTYFTVGTDALPRRIAAKIAADEELCPNLHYLGKRSITTTSDGLRIVALGGALDANLVAGLSKEQHLPFHSADDARSLRAAGSADILLTAAWPANVWNRSAVALDAAHKAATRPSDDVADLCAALRPRYHLSASPDAFFYEREPFVFPPAGEHGAPAPPPASSSASSGPLAASSSSSSSSSSNTVTRFISVAPFGNDAKAKAMYAFTLNRADAAPPPGATPSPFVARHPSKRPRPSDGSSFTRFGQHHHDRHHDRRNNKRRRGGGSSGAPLPGPDRCYFCLSNPNLSTHMCCSIGDDAYVTTAKGPLLTSATLADQGLDFPGHFIIIPLPHAPTLASMGGSLADPASDAAKTLAEMARFRAALQAMLAARSARRLGAVTWEISRARNVHLIWQLIAVPAALVSGGLVEAAFRVEAQNLAYPALTVRNPGDEGHHQGDYFRLWLWAADDDDNDAAAAAKELVMPLDPDVRFDLQFGRRVLAKLMGLEDRFSWQACEQTAEEETKDVAAFRKAFEDWDFTLA